MKRTELGVLLCAVTIAAAVFRASAANVPEAGSATRHDSTHVAGGATATTAQSTIEGAWKVEAYVLRDGRRPRIDGSILFTEEGWAVIFFILDDSGEPRRGSGEGGTYEVTGDQLTFSHQYNMSGGDAVEGYEASELRLTLREPEAAASEACTIELIEDRLVIHFPSGNRMEFSRTSG